jgi:Spy/CpxP family protein refolding chaperone
MAVLMLVLAWTWPVWGQAERPPGSEAQAAQGPSGGGSAGGGPGTGGMPQLTQQQQAAIQAFNETNAPLAQAVTEARNALNAATYTDKPDTANIKAKAGKLAAAELALAQARAEAFAKLQASPSKLDLPSQQIILLLGGSGRRFGGPGGFGGGPGGPPPGPPPDGGFGGPPSDNGGGPGGSQTAAKLSGAFTVDGATQTVADKTLTSDATDQSGVYVINGGSFTMSNVTVTTTGNTSSQENSSFFGQNAGVLVTKNSRVTIFGGRITTTGGGANGLFACGAGAFAAMTGGSITATGEGGHGVMASGGGSLAVTNVDMVTERIHGGVVATDRGGGTIWVSGGKITSHGQDSPGIYSTGDIRAENATFIATASEGAVIEGRNSITLKDCEMSGALKCGVMIYQSFSGDAEGQEGSFTMDGGSLSAAQGPLFFVNNTRGIIHLQNVKLSAPSGVLVNAAASRWGRTGSNGGHVELKGDTQTLSGDINVDKVSSASVALKDHSVLRGTVHNAALTLDGTSEWRVAADSILTSLADEDCVSGATITNIHGNGHTVRYKADLAANQWLGGKTWKLADGGTLAPE